MSREIDASMEDSEQVEVKEEHGDGEEENEENYQEGDEGNDEEGDEEGDEEQAEGEDEGGEEDADDHEIEDVEGEGDGNEEEDGGDAEDADKKFPDPLENIGNFDAIDDPEIKTLMEKTSLKLYDGSKGLILSRGPKYSNEKWPINCHICYESGIYTLKDLKDHLKSTRHVRMMRWRPTDPKYKHMKAFRQPFDDEDTTLTPIFIYPGEVITEITPNLIDRIISKDSVPEQDMAEMVGLCYAYKMKRFGKEIFDCVLCRKVVSILHFAGQKHIDQYIDIHFPKTWKKLRNMIRDGTLGWSTPLMSQQQKHIREVIREIYKKIEAEKGQRQPKFVNYRDFKINRFTYQKQARSKKHYDERSITITDEMLTEYLKKAHEKLGDMKVKPEEDEAKKAERPKRSLRTRDKGRLPVDTRKSKRSSRVIEDDPKVWDRYRRMIGAILDDLEDLYSKEYRRDLESHPKYKSEWKKFWHNRADELERDGIDPHTYDFNKEWIPYWEKRLQEFHAKEIVRQKFETKRKLKLSYDARSPSPVRRRRRSRSPPRRRSPSPRSRQPRARSRSYDGPPIPKRSRHIDSDESITVCSVMRLLTALEDHLGSLGPQAVQLLSRAVLTEKSNPNSYTLLMENEYYVFLMTAKEKLKGRLIANLVEKRKIPAVLEAVDQIGSIVRRFEKFRAQNSGRSHFVASGTGGGNNQYNDNNQIQNTNRYPNQFSGGNRGGVWHSGNYRNENIGANQTMASNQSFNRPAVSGNYGGGGDGGDGFSNQNSGNDYSNRGGGTMNAPPVGGVNNRQMSGGGPSHYGRVDIDSGSGMSYGSNTGGNYSGMSGSGSASNQDNNTYRRNFSGNEGFTNAGFNNASFRAENQRDTTGSVGQNPPSFGANRGRGNIGGISNKGDMQMGNTMGPSRNAMQMGGGQNRQGGGNGMDYNDVLNNRGSGNQLAFNRGAQNRSDNQMDNAAQSSFGSGSGGVRPWSSGYNQSANYKNASGGVSGRSQFNSGSDYSKNSSDMSGSGNFGSGMPMVSGGNNWSSNDFGNSGSNQGFNNRSNQMNPAQFNRNMHTGNRY